MAHGPSSTQHPHEMMAYLAGGIGGIGILLLGYVTRQGRFLPFYSSLLIVIALVYVLFGVMTGRPAVIVAESAIAAGFMGVSILGVRWQGERVGAILIALGLMAHGLFDLGHNAIIQNAAVPAWWPPFCSTVDVIVGLWLITIAWQDRVIARAHHPPEIENRGPSA